MMLQTNQLDMVDNALYLFSMPLTKSVETDPIPTPPACVYVVIMHGSPLEALFSLSRLCQATAHWQPA